MTKTALGHPPEYMLELTDTLDGEKFYLAANVTAVYTEEAKKVVTTNLLGQELSSTVTEQPRTVVVHGNTHWKVMESVDEVMAKLKEIGTFIP